MGNVIEKRAIRQTTTSIEQLLKLQPKKAKRIIDIDNLSFEEVKVSDLALGDIVIVNSGDTIPTDGFVDSGEGAIDESFLTGTFGAQTPVLSIDGRQIADGKIGPITQRIRKLYKTLIDEKCL